MVILLAMTPMAAFAEEPWRFIVTCDSRGYTDGIEQIILREIAAETIDQGADFVLFPGDLVYGSSATDPSGFESQLGVWVEIMKPVYDANVAVYACRGNHEIWDVWGIHPRPDIDPHDNYATCWLAVFGNDLYPKQKLPDNGPAGEKYMTYSVTHKNAFVISLDQYAGIRHEAVHTVNQTWLDARLAANTKPHVFIAGHEPAFRARHVDCLDNQPAERDAFWASIRNAGGRAYFCGHDHFYDHARVDDGDGNPANDIHQYIVGTAGAAPYTWSLPYAGKNGDYAVEQWHHATGFGYVLVEIDGLDVTMIWMERHTNDLSMPGLYEPREVWGYTVTPKPIVLSPNGHENLVAGTSHNITWKTMEGARIEFVKIEYSMDNGHTWREVSPWWNTGSFEWDPVPVVDSNRCLVRIRDLHDVTVHDTSDETFTIFRCLRQLSGDLNGDCYVDFSDLAMLAGEWLECANPFDPSCE